MSVFASGRRTSLSCARSMVHRWQLFGQTVRYGSANKPNSAFHPSGR